MNLVKLNLNPSVTSLPWYSWILIAVSLLIQGTWLFIDARKRSQYPWFWGIWGLTGFPTPLIVYLLVVRKIWKRRRGNK